MIAIIVNKSADLTFRDFMEAAERTSKTDVKVIRYNKRNVKPSEAYGEIVYMTGVEFMEFVEGADDKILKYAQFIIDEFDGLFFEEEQTAKIAIKAMDKVRKVWALSGSNFANSHIGFIVSHCHGSFYDFTLHGKEKIELTC